MIWKGLKISDPVFSTPVKKRAACPSFPPKRPSVALLKGCVPLFEKMLFFC
jgi:hypothetical protein